MNAVEIEEAISLLAEQPFLAAEFPYAFLEAFGNKDTTIRRLRTGNNNRSNIDRGVLQQNNIHIAVCDDGKVNETLQLLKQSSATTKGKVKFILATDGKEFQAEDVNSGETISCDYPSFHNYFGFFLPLAGISTVKQIRENAFDIKATSRLNKLYIELLRHNPDWATSKRRHDMNHFLARLIFCFFAEDTDIFKGDGLFTETVQKMSATDASDTHEIISEIFRSMDVKQDERAEKKVKNWATDFPYVNGQLFSGSTETPKFTKIARSYLLHVGSLDWKKINPDIFGSMIQAVADEDERGSLGMHYTSVPNILKVLNPLFLDELISQLGDADYNDVKLVALRNRISRIRIFDPACGSGNFLVIAYKQLREIEFEINKRLGQNLSPTEIPLTNFRGIELRDFSAEIARLALIIAEYQCDVLYRGQKLALAEFLPLNAENWITYGNALRVNWLSICPPTGKSVKIFSEDLFSSPVDMIEIDFKNEGGETYLCGNPPYLGSTWQSKEQKSEIKDIVGSRSNSPGFLDYVSGWFIKAADWIRICDGKAAFVSTNSVCQGQMVPLLWPMIYKAGCEIKFAHTSFRWTNLASHNAGVSVVIVGIGRLNREEKILFEEDNAGKLSQRLGDVISPYLTMGTSVIVEKSREPLSKLSEMEFGNKPSDGGNLLLATAEIDSLNLTKIQKLKFLRKILGSEDFINGGIRYCIWITNSDLEEASKIPEIAQRIDRVRELRLASKDKGANSLAKRAHQLKLMRIANYHTIIVPAVSSEKRPFLPVGLVASDTTLTNAAFGLYDAPIYNIAIISSRIHLVWIRTICGQLENRIRYSNTMGWNTFPVPILTEKNKEDLTKSAEEILSARERYFPATIADLYDPEKMPEDLRRAHERNDEILERIYIGRRFKNDTERLEKLFDLYIQMSDKTKPI